MSRQADLLKARTKQFALDVLAFVDGWVMPVNPGDRRIADQLSVSSTSVAANYRARQT